MFLCLVQVFHSLLKAHAVEARTVVRQALEILTPAMPGRMEDGNVSNYGNRISGKEGKLYKCPVMSGWEVLIG